MATPLQQALAQFKDAKGCHGEVDNPCYVPAADAFYAGAAAMAEIAFAGQSAVLEELRKLLAVAESIDKTLDRNL